MGARNGKRKAKTDKAIVMEKAIYSLWFILTALLLQAQNNPYAQFGDSTTVLHIEPYMEHTNENEHGALKIVMTPGRINYIDSAGLIVFSREIKAWEVNRWLSVDPLAHKAPSDSPYLYAGGNPIFYKDPDGQFKIAYTEESLAANGLTLQDVVRFENVIKNISNLVANNPVALDAISATTGFSKERILSDLTFGQGPEVTISEDYRLASGSITGVNFDPSLIKAFSSIDGADQTELSTQTLGIALTTLHEYGHFGDKNTNDGNNSGQFSYNANGTRLYDSESFGDNNIKFGKQKWGLSWTGHRGTDIETIGFGVQVEINQSTKDFTINPAKYGSSVPSSAPPIPTSLPVNAQGTNILQTLGVE